MTAAQPRFALVAGEASGDQLGAALIRELRLLYPDAEFVGVGGALMRAEGMQTWWDSEELAVFGLFEVLSHFSRLWKLRKQLLQRLLANPPAVFIGIDAPDFNLGLEIKLKRAGIPTAHYVSPTVWAWRENRVHKIARATHRVLCLFPFEPKFYAGHGVDAHYVGHPLADQIQPQPRRQNARAALGLDAEKPTVALLPGSRKGEVGRLSGPMIEAARALRSQRPELQFVAALNSEPTRFLFREAMEDIGFFDITLLEGQAKQAMAAADVVVCASGTVTLEAALINRPMVVAYRLAPATYRLAKHLRLVRPQFISLPNILAGEALVPELIQQQANGADIAVNVADWLDQPQRCEALAERFTELQQELRCNAGRQAALAVSELLTPGSTTGMPAA